MLPLFLVGCVGASTQLSVGFPSADGFRPGDPVLFEEDRIGTVVDVNVQQARTVVEIELQDSEPQLRASAIFRLQTPGLFGGERAVILVDPGTGTLLESGSEVRGYTRAELALVSVNKIARALYAGAKEAISRAAREVQTNDGRAFLDELKAVAEEGDKSVQWLKEQAPEWDRKLRKLQARLEAAGKSDEAQALEDAFNSLFKQK